MSAVLTPPHFADAEAYLAWEELQTERHELVDGEAYAMTGARANHNLIAGNAYIWLRQALRGAPCRVFVTEHKLHVNAEGDFLYPDVMVTCDPRDRQPSEDRFVSHPGWWLKCSATAPPPVTAAASSRPTAPSTRSPTTCWLSKHGRVPSCSAKTSRACGCCGRWPWATASPSPLAACPRPGRWPACLTRLISRRRRLRPRPHRLSPEGSALSPAGRQPADTLQALRKPE